MPTQGAPEAPDGGISSARGQADLATGSALDRQDQPGASALALALRLWKSGTRFKPSTHPQQEDRVRLLEKVINMQKDRAKGPEVEACAC